MAPTKKQKTTKVAAASSSKSRPTKAAVPKREKRWTWTKPKDKPRRPLSAYNLFFRLERELLIKSKGKRGTAAESKDSLTIAVAKILADTKAERMAEERAGGPIEHKRPHRKGCGNLGFKNLANTIADRWKNLDQSDRTIYEAAAALEMKQYKQDIERWQLKQKLKKSGGGNEKKGGTTVQDTSAQGATTAPASNSFASVFNPSIQVDFTSLPHIPEVAGNSTAAGPTGASNTYESQPVRKSCSSSSLSFLVEAGLLPATIMEEEHGGLSSKDVPLETHQELLEKAPDMSQLFDDDMINFLASPDYDQAQATYFPTLPNHNNTIATGAMQQRGASASVLPSAVGQVTYEKKPPAREESKSNSTEQPMVPAPNGRQVPFGARTA